MTQIFTRGGWGGGVMIIYTWRKSPINLISLISIPAILLLLLHVIRVVWNNLIPFSLLTIIHMLLLDQRHCSWEWRKWPLIIRWTVLILKQILPKTINIEGTVMKILRYACWYWDLKGDHWWCTMYLCPILVVVGICNQVGSNKQVQNLWLEQMTHYVLKCKWSINWHKISMSYQKELAQAKLVESWWLQAQLNSNVSNLLCFNIICHIPIIVNTPPSVTSPWNAKQNKGSYFSHYTVCSTLNIWLRNDPIRISWRWLLLTVTRLLTNWSYMYYDVEKEK